MFPLYPFKYKVPKPQADAVIKGLMTALQHAKIRYSLEDFNNIRDTVLNEISKVLSIKTPSPYYAVSETISKAGFDNNKVTIYDHNLNLPVFSFIRNYPSFSIETTQTFFLNNYWYLLYSPCYTSLKIYNLSLNKPVEIHTSNIEKFCPVSLRIPWSVKDKKSDELDFDLQNSQQVDNFSYLPLALVQGCVWGDDNGNFYLNLLDLSQIEDGILNYFSDSTNEWLYMPISLTYNFDIHKDIYIDCFSDNKIQLHLPFDKVVRVLTDKKGIILES